MTPFQRHVARWRACTACPLSEQRRQVVIARGSLPAPILFIGEAPGPSEDALGKPFIGPAGKLLDRAIAAAISDSRLAIRADTDMAWTNLVCCMPKDEEGRKRGEPVMTEVEACGDRLNEFIGLCQPKLIVAVGSLSEKRAKQLQWAKSRKVISILHPSAILRMDVSQQGLAYQRVVVQLSDAFCDLADSLVPF